MKNIFPMLFLILLSNKLFAQDLNFYGILPSYSQTGVLNPKFDYNFFTSVTDDLIKRTYASPDNPQNEIPYPAKILQLYFQPSIIYKYSPNLNFALSLTYNYQRNNPLALYFNEIRPWQQVVYSHGLSKGRMAHRIRLEERLIKTQVDKRRLSNRIRYQVGLNIPLQGKSLDAHEFYFNCYNEFYFSLSNPPARPRSAFYSENWTYFGLGFNTGKFGRLEIGPLYQTAYRNITHEKRNLSLLQLLWVTNFTFKKKD